MNIRHAIVDKPPVKAVRFLKVSFNQDESCFSCGTQDGFVVFNSDPLTCKLIKKFDDKDNNGIGLTRMLYRTNYTALVGGGKKPRYPLNKLIIWDDLRKTETSVLKFMSPVKDVFLSRVYIIVVLENSIEIFYFQPTPTRICPSLDIYPNGIVDFVMSQSRIHRRRSIEMENSESSSSLQGILAFPSARSVGQVHITNLSQLKHSDSNPSGTRLLPTSIIKAHKSAIRMLRLNPQGTMVATCSVQGTLIRIFSTLNGSLLREFRRGLDRADIYDMAFSHGGTKLAVVSDKQTLHIFQVLSSTHPQNNESTITNNKPNMNDSFDHGKNKVHALRDVIPNVWKPKYIDSIWSMCSIHLTNPLLRSSSNNDNDPDFLHDRCKIGWCRDATGYTNGNVAINDDDEDSLILVWQNRGIWEKYVILEKEESSYSTSETLRTEKQDIKKWDLIRESWRQI
ncbi:hypothetical protein Kpol_1050p55 [Vanderwaltozyma polyspora DSM 70294]|uniref:SVP1-like protein 2 n=1 Tax=Vanderwaltozyma polyspora (strain ATCC 22028 / DSM 70294 / BCRC 21397 / CBS 2163 / NBRC 10782 / NRRL Y-8283 / UCD 57-17) TaxID=436907 RepID=A7TEV2_VANPO|nr:uncharacterized protein Kpol_1050p55 [Vanderwaltozyma polyspora DSM 70294]EDO19198.1 hypothetical protein Kpol_1050p55 [Vanderwaltozyma polyspora DSM 70294]